MRKTIIGQRTARWIHCCSLLLKLIEFRLLNTNGPPVTMVFSQELIRAEVGEDV